MSVVSNAALTESFAMRTAIGAREAISSGGLMWLLLGGISYTAGTIFYAWGRLPFNHAIWHLFVLGGSVCHYLAVLFHVLPARVN